jgi:D-tyrosyl-tRNA(Tyr) deacylase
LRAVIQRVSKSSVRVGQQVVGTIDSGMTILLGVDQDDDYSDAEWLIKKLCALRIFADKNGQMNKSIIDINGAFLVISQFTLHASYKKGNRPSFLRAAKPEKAKDLYERFCQDLKKTSTLKVETGIFGADMAVNITNDGPVTIIMDSKNKE